jgi:hypothetical protein
MRTPTARAQHSRAGLRHGSDLTDTVAEAALIAVEIVRRKAGRVGFAVQPWRWVIERTFARFGRNRRLERFAGQVER